MKFEISRRRQRPAADRKIRANRFRPLVELLEDRVTPVNIGYYDMSLGAGNSTQVPAINVAGHMPVQLFDLTPADLAGLAVIDVQNPNNGGYGAEYLSHLTDIENAVAGGAVLVIHDRFVDPAETILPAGAAFNIIRDFSDGANINVLDNTTLVTNGPGGIVNDTTLDGGNFSSHGFAFANSLPVGAALILTTGDPTHIVTFAYNFGAGTVIYSTIPLDFYLPSGNNFANIYAPNVLAYAATNPLGARPEVSADNPSITEGSTGSTSIVTFTLTRSGSVAGTTVVNWTTTDGTATAGVDYVAASGQVTFLSGESQKTVQITVNGDDTPEFDETFNLDLSSSGATVTDGQARILNDDVITISADNPSVAEGPAGSTAIVTFTLQRTGILAGAGVVNWSTVDGTATAGSDYVAASGQVTFQDGETQKTVEITVNGDDVPEFDETFSLDLSTTSPGWTVNDGQARILNDDVTTVSADNPSAAESQTGSTSIMTFTLTRTGILAGVAVVDWTTADGTATAGSDYVPASGQVTFQDGETQKIVEITVNGDDTIEPNETFNLVLTPVSPGCVANSGQATILNDDFAKFFVINEGQTNYYSPYPSPNAGPDRTYWYAASGNSQGNATLDTGNSSPRGAASSAAADKLWIVDANKTVYVYGTEGTLLGSWTAESLHDRATPEGISTDGVDIWIVDSLEKKVFRYQGAAARLSGSQSADSSFNLNWRNFNPKGIVTDGAAFWVVDDATIDKVFKYTLAGAYLGSWTIDAANKAPTGITLDPTDVRHLWIVDNRSYRIYQYDNAAGRTFGSQAAALSTALAAGNINPQDIADPPPPFATPGGGGRNTVSHRQAAATRGSHGTTPPPLATDWRAAIEWLFAQESTTKRRR